LATALQFGDELTAMEPQEAAASRYMARLVFASFWTIVFTGAVRKWIAPGVTALYLLQDIPIGLAYIYALYTGLFTRGYMMLGIMLLTAVLTLQGLLQIIVSGLSPVVAFIGLHNYLFYLPMLLIFSWAFTKKYRTDYIRWNLLLSLPMCLLAVVQAQAPKSAWINKSSSGDAFGVPGADVARVTGTFNFTAFYGIWVAAAVALCVGEWLLPKESRAIKSTWLLLTCTFAVNVCHLISASRGAVALAVTSILGGVVAAFILRSYRALFMIGGLALLLPVGAAATYALSPSEFNIMTERFTRANEVDSTKTRLMDGVIGFITIPDFSLIGAGVGMGVDAAHVDSTDSNSFTYALSEIDVIRNVMELGTPVGLLYVLTRIGFLVGMILFAVYLVRNGSSPHVLPLAFFLFAQAYAGDVTRNGTMTASQIMLGYSFILGVYYHPDNRETDSAAIDSPTRYA